MKANIIKARFIDFLLACEAKPSLICSELLFHDGLRRADLATLNNGGLHAYEIKSSSDDLRKLSSQLVDYMNCFNSVSIITDKKHLPEIRNVANKKVGLFIAGSGLITRIRKPTYIARPNKASRLHMLTKVELLSSFKDLFEKENLDRIDKSNDKTFIIDSICKIIDSKRIMRETEKLILEKNKHKYHTFLAERGEVTLEEDIFLLHYNRFDII